MSKHECPVVKIKKSPHPNADALSIMEVYGWEVCMRTDEWEDGQLAIYVPPDYVVPDTELFAFLKSDSSNWNRIRTRKFRQRYSHGVLVPAPEGFQEGDDAMEAVGIERWVPPLPLSAGGDNVAGPAGFYPKYDVENMQRFPIIQEGEEVLITEKIHGANARFTCVDDVMYAGSRTMWKKQDPHNLWWQAIVQNPWIEQWCRANQGYVLYGEVFGNVQNLKYGAKGGQIFFRAFDILDKDRWMEVDETAQRGWDAQIQWVPTVYRGPFNKEKAVEMSLGNSALADHMMEGVVVRVIPERHDPECGRVQLKIVSARYLEKAKD